MELSNKNLGIIRDALICYSNSLRNKLESIRNSDIPDDDAGAVIVKLSAELFNTESLQEMVEILINKQ